MTIKELYKEFLNSSGVSTDTRTIASNDMFFALKGDNFNGNLYVDLALEKGCRFVVCDDLRYEGKEKVWVVQVSFGSKYLLS